MWITKVISDLIPKINIPSIDAPPPNYQQRHYVSIKKFILNHLNRYTQKVVKQNKNVIDYNSFDNHFFFINDLIDVLQSPFADPLHAINIINYCIKEKLLKEKDFFVIDAILENTSKHNKYLGYFICRRKDFDNPEWLFQNILLSVDLYKHYLTYIIAHKGSISTKTNEIDKKSLALLKNIYTVIKEIQYRQHRRELDMFSTGVHYDQSQPEMLNFYFLDKIFISLAHYYLFHNFFSTRENIVNFFKIPLNSTDIVKLLDQNIPYVEGLFFKKKSPKESVEIIYKYVFEDNQGLGINFKQNFDLFIQEILESNFLDQKQRDLLINIKKVTTYGAALLLPKRIDNAFLYLQRNNLSVRELKYNFEQDALIADDATILSEHITKSGIKDMEYQEAPDGILWCVRNDGQLATMTRLASQDVLAWSKHDTQGSYQSIAIIPAGN
ncbi:MAG: hypothetical protein KKA19_01590, partial [Candidatus Margulisbacteria bacterium]|nr:hypothetical protein [Candidatus Margulisiibacteriota bacterium]